MEALYSKIDGVADILGISPSTIKKYYLLFEQRGFRFRRNAQSHVMFSDRDIQMFRKLIQLKNEPGISVNKAVDLILKTATDITDMTVTSNEDITDITDMPDIRVMTQAFEQVNQIKEVVLNQQKLLSLQQDQISHLISKQEESTKLITQGVSERDKLLMESIRETQEVKKMLIELNEKQNKKWWKFF